MKQLPLHFDMPSRPAAGGSVRLIQLPGRVMSYRFVRGRRRTIGLFIDADGLEARAPRHTPVSEVEAFMREKEKWIARRLGEAGRRPPPMSWREGALLPYLGGELRLSAAAGLDGVRRNSDRLEIGSAFAHARWREQVLGWLHVAALAIFRERVTHYAARMGIAPPSPRLSNARTQWGSCGANGRILLNWRLIMMPQDLIDYVVVHELAHLHELNHSPGFWAVVARLYPQYKTARKELHRRSKQLPDF